MWLSIILTLSFFRSRWLGMLVVAGLDARGALATQPHTPLPGISCLASDSLTISGIVRGRWGIRQPRAQLRLVRWPMPTDGTKWVLAVATTNQDGEFLVRIDSARASDSLRIQVACAPRPGIRGYMWYAERLVAANRQTYTVRLRKQRIYPKAR